MKTRFNSKKYEIKIYSPLDKSVKQVEGHKSHPPGSGSIIYRTVPKYFDVSKWDSLITPNNASQMRISARIQRL